MSSGAQDYYLVAAVAARKMHIWENHKEDAIQYVVLALWESNLDRHLTFKKLLVIACNKAKDYLRKVNGHEHFSRAKTPKVYLKDSHLQKLSHDPTDSLDKKLDLQKTMSPMLEELLVNGTSARDYAKAIGVTEGYISQQVSAEIAKLKRKLK